MAHKTVWKTGDKKQKKLPGLVGEDKKVPKVPNSTTSHERKRILSKLVYAHNIGWKFPLKNNCKIPFTKYLKQIGLNNNKQFLLSTKTFFARQTTKNLFIFPAQLAAPATKGQAQVLKDNSRARAINIVKRLQRKHIGLRVLRPLPEPISQEYAFKDDFADRLKFTFKSDKGVKIDKSPHPDETGHIHTGGEIEFPTPEMADDYCALPDNFKKVVDIFSVNLASLAKNINLHLDVEQRQAVNQEKMNELLSTMMPKQRRASTSLKESATARGCS